MVTGASPALGKTLCLLTAAPFPLAHRCLSNFPRNLESDFGQYTGERPADFAKAMTAREMDGTPKQRKEN